MARIHPRRLRRWEYPVMFQSLENRSLKSSNRWKFFAVLFPIIGTCAMAQGPGSQVGFFQAWWGKAGFRPSNLPNLIFWIDASQEGTVNVDGGRVAAITDLSTNAYTVQQLTTANRPAYLIAERNGLNVMRYTAASNHFLRVTTNAIPASHTVFFVFQRPASGTRSIGLGASVSSGGAARYPFWWDVDNVIYQNNNGSLTTHGSSTNTGWFYATTRRTGTTQVRIRRNGTTISTLTTGGGVTSPSSGNWALIGSAEGSATGGDIAEIIAYSTALSDDEILQVEDYLARKWGF
jgi:hypothetical protein